MAQENCSVQRMFADENKRKNRRSNPPVFYGPILKQLDSKAQANAEINL